jgi:hypothetical protein
VMIFILPFLGSPAGGLFVGSGPEGVDLGPKGVDSGPEGANSGGGGETREP